MPKSRHVDLNVQLVPIDVKKIPLETEVDDLRAAAYQAR